MATPSQRGVEFSKRDNTLSIDFGGSAIVSVDLNQIKMTSSQSAILSKLIRGKPGFTLAECTGDDCPAAERLTPDEFKQIRELKATLGASGEAAGLVCDFCLKCVNV